MIQFSPVLRHSRQGRGREIQYHAQLERLDEPLCQHQRQLLVLVGDVNQHQVAGVFNEFLDVFGLLNDVSFATPSVRVIT